MFPALSRPARRWALAIALLAAVSLAAQFLHLEAVGAVASGHTAWEMARYFTILTAVLVTGTFAVISRPLRRGLPAPWLAAVTLSMVMVGGVYHVLLSDLVAFTGLGWWADQGLHSAVPLAVLIWWLVYAPKRTLDYADLPVFVLWPTVYVAYALWRGARDGVYPYPFVDLTTLGPAAVAINLCGLALLFLLGGVVMISIGRYADR